eukprot:5251829-Pyramimonas_sp.AAC.1
MNTHPLIKSGLSEAVPEKKSPDAASDDANSAAVSDDEETLASIAGFFEIEEHTATRSLPAPADAAKKHD